MRSHVALVAFSCLVWALVGCSGSDVESSSDTQGTDTSSAADGTSVDGASQDGSGSGDRTAPTVQIETPVDGEYVTGSFSVAVAASDDVGVERVALTVDGDVVSTRWQAPFEWTLDVGQMPAGTLMLRALAYDDAGNVGSAGVAVMVRGACSDDGDCPPHGIRIVTPVDGAELCGVVTIEATASDDRGITRFDFFVDEEPLGSSSMSPYQQQWDTTRVANGEHTLRVVVTDTKEQQAFARIWIEVRNSVDACDNLPNLRIENPPNGSYVAGEIPVRVRAADDIGVTGVQFFLDNALVTDDASTPYGFDWDTTQFDEGGHTLKAIAEDTSGQTASHQIHVTVDHTPPTVRVLTPVDGSTVGERIAVAVEATDEMGVEQVQIVVDDGVLAVRLDSQPWQTTLDASALEPGLHRIVATAHDRAGHTAQHSVDVHLDPPPDVTILTPEDGADVHGPTVVSVAASDDGELGPLLLYVDGDYEGAFDEAGEILWIPPFLDASHVLRAVARDDRNQMGFDEVEVHVSFPSTIRILRCDNGVCATMADGQEVHGVLSLRTQVQDTTGVDRVDLGLGASLLSSDTSPPYEFLWDTATAEDGARTLVATAIRGGVADDSTTVILDVNNCDRDHDGVAAVGGSCGGTDCADDDPRRNPSAEDAVGDGLDQNCDGADGVDWDRDGIASRDSGGADCDDHNPQRYPGAEDTVGDVLDQNCDLVDGVDADRDGFASEGSGGTDCNDADSLVSPSALDIAGDGIDRDCDGVDGVDADGDGYASVGSGGDDCDDRFPDIHPCAADLPGDGIDADCDDLDALSCDDCSPCTDDSYDGVSCRHTPVPDGRACEDGSLCTSGEQCVAGACAGGVPVVCSDADGNPCTAEVCDAIEGCVPVDEPYGTVCNSESGICFLGECAPQPPCAEQCPTVEMAVVPRGAQALPQGCDPAVDAECPGSSQPRHDVSVPPFAIQRMETTQAEYQRCADAGACAVPAVGTHYVWDPENRPAHPAVSRNWADADAYCTWLGARLCSESEWEKAARGLDGRTYPWGDLTAGCVLAIMNTGSPGCGRETTWPVGSRPLGVSPYSVLDLAGNAPEWVADDWHDTYVGAPTQGQAWVESPRRAFRVIRGGGYLDSGFQLRGFMRRAAGAQDSEGAAIRCCRDLD